MNRSRNTRSIDWLINWLVDQLIDWSIYWLELIFKCFSAYSSGVSYYIGSCSLNLGVEDLELNADSLVMIKPYPKNLFFESHNTCYILKFSLPWSNKLLDHGCYYGCMCSLKITKNVFQRIWVLFNSKNDFWNPKFEFFSCLKRAGYPQNLKLFFGSKNIQNINSQEWCWWGQNVS